MLEVRETSSNKLIPYKTIGATYDYAYLVPEIRSVSHRQLTATPDRPIIRYWNNFVRNIRVPVPTVTWNITKPFRNLFNADVTNLIDTPVRDYDNSSKRRKRKRNKNTKKHSTAPNTNNSIKQKQKYTPPVYTGFNEGVQQTLGYNNQQYVNQAMFFYDPQTGQYYRIHQPPAQYTHNYSFEEELQEPEPEPQVQQFVQALEDEQEAEHMHVQKEDAESEHKTEVAETPQQVEEVDEPAAQEAPEVVQSESLDSEESLEGTAPVVEQVAHNSAEDLPSGVTGHLAGEVVLVPENDEELEEERTLTSIANNKFILPRKPNVKNLAKLRNSMNGYVIHHRGSKKRQQADTKNKSKYKLVIYLLK